MQSDQPIQVGMEVFGADGERLGQVSAIHGDATTRTIEIDGRYRVPFTAIDRVEADRVMLPNPATLYRTQLRQNEPDDAATLSGAEAHFADMQGHVTGVGEIRDFDEAEANFRAGYEAGLNPAYQGRDFDDVEEDLRSQYTMPTPHATDDWTLVRDEVRKGWNKARGL
jgi:hypothetical protein